MKHYNIILSTADVNGTQYGASLHEWKLGCRGPTAASRPGQLLLLISRFI